jgi:hypothetical protein
MKYKIVWENTVGELTTTVNELIQNGWNPQGGVSLGYGGSYIQAMVKTI